MKDFAKSIVCNTKTGNSNKAEIIEKKKKEGATLKVDNGQKLEFSDGSTYVKTSFSDDYREAHNYTGNTKVGNYTPNYRYKGFLITNPEGYEFVVFLQDGLHVGYRGTTSKAQAEDWCDWHDPKTGKPVAKFRNSKTGNDTPWEYAHRKPKVINDDKTGNSNKAEIIEKKKKEGATLKVDNGQKLEFSDGSTYVKTSFSDDYREAHNYTGNTKVGNANTHLTASNSGELWLNFDGTGEMYDPIELGRYDFSGKSEALSVARELEQLKRKAEQKVKDADKFINAIKQWAAGLK